MLVRAYLNHGRWVADCPRCNSSDLADRAKPEFVCRPEYQGCGLVAAIQFPEDYDDIMAVAAARSSPLNRNWRPGESVIDMRIENAAHHLQSEGSWQGANQ